MWWSCKRCSCASSRVRSLRGHAEDAPGRREGQAKRCRYRAGRGDRWSCGGPGSGSARARVSSDVGDVAGAEGLKGEAVGDRAGHGIGGGRSRPEPRILRTLVARVEPAVAPGRRSRPGHPGDGARKCIINRCSRSGCAGRSDPWRDPDHRCLHDDHTGADDGR